MRIVHGAFTALLLIASAQASDVLPAQEAEVTLRDFRFHTGQTLPELRMHYRTVGSSSGEPVLILCLVVTVIGGIGSINGALVAAILIGLIDTFGRVLLSPALGSMVIFLAMAVILAFKPKGLFPVHG